MGTVRVLYHGNCPDGMTAAWVAWRRFCDKAMYDAVLHGRPMPDIPNDCEVFLLDFCYPREQLLELAARCRVTVLDHHKTAEQELKDLPVEVTTVFDLNKSGAMLAWEHFFPDEKASPPRIVQYAQDRDLWLFKLPHSQEIAQLLVSYRYDVYAWEQIHSMLEGSFNTALIEGRALLRLRNACIAQMCERAEMKFVGVYEVPTVNATFYFSEVCEALCTQYPEAAFAASYRDRGNGEREWSLRGRGNFDVSEVAKEFGGGGHRDAAGFIEKLNTQEDGNAP